MSTADVSFIAAGAFSGLHQVARRRASAESIGFGRNSPGGPSPDAVAVSFTSEEVDHVANFQAYGFLPELLSRFSRFVPFQALDAATLTDILKSNVIDRLTHEFEDEGFELNIEEPVIQMIVAEGLKRETGARGLQQVLIRHIEGAAFESFAEASGRVRVYLDAGAIKVETQVQGGAKGERSDEKPE